MEQIKTRFIQQENTRGRKEVYMQELHISVRNLVEFIFRAGDIDNRAGKLASAEAMMEGSRIHRKIQKSMDTSYQAEVPLKIEWKANDYVLVVEGRADGIAYGKFQPDLPAATESVLQPEMEFAAEIPPEEEISFIDEIKGVYRNVAAMEQPVYVHKAQAMCYAYIYAKQNRLERIGVQMTYCNLDTEEIRYFRILVNNLYNLTYCTSFTQMPICRYGGFYKVRFALRFR
jgi:DNA excision repair protein ERCC-2